VNIFDELFVEWMLIRISIDFQILKVRHTFLLAIFIPLCMRMSVNKMETHENVSAKHFCFFYFL